MRSLDCPTTSEEVAPLKTALHTFSDINSLAIKCCACRLRNRNHDMSIRRIKLKAEGHLFDHAAAQGGHVTEKRFSSRNGKQKPSTTCSKN
jgi:hypothetical protein